MRLVCLLACLLGSAAAWRCSPPVCSEAKPRRQKKNKYAQFSKADEVRKSLRFSRIDDPATAAAKIAWLAAEAGVMEAGHGPAGEAVFTGGYLEAGYVLGGHRTYEEVPLWRRVDDVCPAVCPHSLGQAPFVWHGWRGGAGLNRSTDRSVSFP